MSLLYISDIGAKIGIEANRLTIKYQDGMLQSYPIEAIDGITLLGGVQLTTHCMEHCLMRGIPVSFFSKGGKYFGRLMSTGHAKAPLQRKQSALYDTDFGLILSRKIIRAKINNQLVVARRYAKSRSIDISTKERVIGNEGHSVAEAGSINELMGHEGYAARAYFGALSMCIESEFRFNGRSKRPPRDEFNSLISLGYSILMNECYSEIGNHGLNPYFGFLHRDGENHPTLASDLMEEWRAVIVDSLAMSMINGHEISKEDFVTDVDEPGCFLTRGGLKKYLGKLESKLQTKMQYLKELDYPVNFRTAIGMQIDHLAKAIDAEDAELYHPVQIR